MTYKGYRAEVECGDDVGVLSGRVVNTRDVVFFEGSSVEELNREFKFSIDDYLAMCAERGEEPDRPCSGKYPLE